MALDPQLANLRLRDLLENGGGLRRLNRDGFDPGPVDPNPGNGGGGGRRARGRLVGLGVASPAGAGASTVTTTVTKPIRKGARLYVQTASGVVLSVTSIVIDSQNVYIDTTLPVDGLDLRNVQAEGMPLPSINRTIAVTVNVGAACTWGIYVKDADIDGLGDCS